MPAFRSPVTFWKWSWLVVRPVYRWCVSESRRIFGRTPLTAIDPDKVVAIGAAIQADILSATSRTAKSLLDVIPLSGLENDGRPVKIPAQHHYVPVARAQISPPQRRSDRYVYPCDAGRTRTGRLPLAGAFALCGDSAVAAGGRAHIRVTFRVDADGLLSVTAMENPLASRLSPAQVKPSYGLTDSEIASMIGDSMSFAEQDVKARMLAEQKSKPRVLESLTGALIRRRRAVKRRRNQCIDDAAALKRGRTRR